MKRYFAWLFLLFLVPAIASAAEVAEYSEGIDYQLLSRAQPVANDGSVEMVELFWYGCSPCYRLVFTGERVACYLLFVIRYSLSVIRYP